MAETAEQVFRPFSPSNSPDLSDCVDHISGGATSGADGLRQDSRLNPTTPLSLFPQSTLSAPPPVSSLPDCSYHSTKLAASDNYPGNRVSITDIIHPDPPADSHPNRLTEPWRSLLQIQENTRPQSNLNASPQLVRRSITLPATSSDMANWSTAYTTHSDDSEQAIVAAGSTAAFAPSKFKLINLNPPYNYSDCFIDQNDNGDFSRAAGEVLSLVASFRSRHLISGRNYTAATEAIDCKDGGSGADTRVVSADADYDDINIVSDDLFSLCRAGGGFDDRSKFGPKTAETSPCLIVAASNAIEYLINPPMPPLLEPTDDHDEHCEREACNRTTNIEDRTLTYLESHGRYLFDADPPATITSMENLFFAPPNQQQERITSDIINLNLWPPQPNGNHNYYSCSVNHSNAVDGQHHNKESTSANSPHLRDIVGTSSCLNSQEIDHYHDGEIQISNHDLSVVNRYAKNQGLNDCGISQYGGSIQSSPAAAESTSYADIYRSSSIYVDNRDHHEIIHPAASVIDRFNRSAVPVVPPSLVISNSVNEDSKNTIGRWAIDYLNHKKPAAVVKDSRYNISSANSSMHLFRSSILCQQYDKINQPRRWSAAAGIAVTRPREISGQSSSITSANHDESNRMDSTQIPKSFDQILRIPASLCLNRDDHRYQLLPQPRSLVLCNSSVISTDNKHEIRRRVWTEQVILNDNIKTMQEEEIKIITDHSSARRCPGDDHTLKRKRENMMNQTLKRRKVRERLAELRLIVPGLNRHRQSDFCFSCFDKLKPSISSNSNSASSKTPDTAEALKCAADYIRFLHAQLQILQMERHVDDITRYGGRKWMPTSSFKLPEIGPSVPEEDQGHRRSGRIHCDRSSRRREQSSKPDQTKDLNNSAVAGSGSGSDCGMLCPDGAHRITNDAQIRSTLVSKRFAGYTDQAVTCIPNGFLSNQHDKEFHQNADGIKRAAPTCIQQNDLRFNEHNQEVMKRLKTTDSNHQNMPCRMNPLPSSTNASISAAEHETRMQSRTLLHRLLMSPIVQEKLWRRALCLGTTGVQAYLEGSPRKKDQDPDQEQRHDEFQIGRH